MPDAKCRLAGEFVHAAAGVPQGGNCGVGKIPLNVEELTTSWLNQVFVDQGRASGVSASRVERIIWGTATKVLMHVEYKDPGIARPTQDICVKGAFDEKIRNYFDIGSIFVAEAAFYRDVAPQLSILLPECLYAQEDGAYGVIVLENLAARGVTFGNLCEALRAERAAMVLHLLAGLHGTTWGWRPGTLPWLCFGSPAARSSTLAMMAKDKFEALSQRPHVAPFIGASYCDQERLLAALSILWKRDDSSASVVLSHGDAHLGQLYFETDGTPGLLDWQGIGLMPCLKDVAYFIGGALSIADRRHHERDLLEIYLRALQRCGGPRISLQDAWDEYRAHMLQGIIWTVVPEQMQPVENLAAMNERYLVAMRDLDSLGALGL